MTKKLNCVIIFVKYLTQLSYICIKQNVFLNIKFLRVKDKMIGEIHKLNVEKKDFFKDKLRLNLFNEQSIVNELNFALNSGQFKVYLQPIYSMSKNKFISSEALIRWHHPVKGIIYPSVFIPIFERNGYISEIDCFVYKTVLKYLRERIKSGKKVIPISVNISRVNFNRLTIYECITSLAREYDIDRNYLRFEVTESAYSDNPEQLMESVKRLHDSGFKILIDDFGSGFSSLNMLTEISADYLKIDKCFVDKLEKFPKTREIVANIIEMAKNLNMKVIAEGVETKKQSEILTKLGADLMQGYFFARPMLIEDFSELLDSEKI